MDHPDLDVREFTEPVWYRVEGEHYDGAPVLRLNTYKVRKHTAKAAQLVIGGFSKDTKLVKRDYVHRARAFAAPTVEQALIDFQQRKRYHILCMEGRLNRAREELDLALSKSVKFK